MRALAATMLLGALMACEDGPEIIPPEKVVRQFVESLQAFDGTTNDAKELYEMLSERAASNLMLRAERYSAASGKQIGPWAMLVPSRTSLRFMPESYSAHIAGQYALVTVSGQGKSAQIPCVLDDDQWRLDLVLPALPEVVLRPGLSDE